MVPQRKDMKRTPDILSCPLIIAFQEKYLEFSISVVENISKRNRFRPCREPRRFCLVR